MVYRNKNQDLQKLFGVVEELGSEQKVEYEQ